MAGKSKRFHFNFLSDLLGEKKERGFRFDTHNGILTETQKTKKNYSHHSTSYISHGRGGYTTQKDTSSKQNCIFKSSHRYDKALNAKHLAYIQKEGRGVAGATPELYGADPEGYEERMAKLHFRFIISPENPNVDLNELTQDFIKRLELRTGHRLDWVAANHYNTGQKHTHILINGFDLNRNKVQFNRLEISRFMRESLRELCTEQVGNRTLQEREASNQKQVESNSFTFLDRQLATILEKTKNITINSILKSTQPTLFHSRLLHLRDIGVITLNPQTEEFVFPPDWQEQLKLFGRYNTFLDGLAFCKAHPSHYSLHNIDNLGPVSGKVIKKYYMQENSNNHAVVLETSPNYFVYVPLFEAPVNAPVGGNINIEFQRIQTSSGSSRKIMNITNQN